MKTKKIILGIVGLAAVIVIAGLALYRPVIRPWQQRWGASDAEVRMALPGDEIVAGLAWQATRAVDIQVPAAQVWPWLVQMGRGGLYSYDWLENLVGCDIHTLDAIDPALQDLKVGDPIKIGRQKGLPYYQVVLLEPEKALLLRSVDPTTGAMGETWGFYLIEKGNGLTRLIVRHRTPPSQDSTAQIVNAVFEPISFFMEHRMLYGIRDHAQKPTRSRTSASITARTSEAIRS